MAVNHRYKGDKYIRSVIVAIAWVFFPAVVFGVTMGFGVFPAFASIPTSRDSDSLSLPDPTAPPPEWTPWENEAEIEKGQPPEKKPSRVLLPDLQTLPPADFRLVVDQEAGRKFLRFSNSIWNSGPGVLELRGEYNRENDTITVTQNIYQEDGSLIEREAGEFNFHHVHNHWHWEGFSLYEVWSIELNGSLSRLLASSGKVGYCVRDSSPYHTDRNSVDLAQERSPTSNPGFTSCYWAHQGLSVGWRDTYKANVSGQFVEISQLDDGIYALKTIVDPENFIFEENDSNNSAVAYFSMRENRIEVLEYIFVPTKPKYKIE